MRNPEARALERRFIRQMQKRCQVNTATGKPNLFVGHDRRSLRIRTVESDHIIKIARQKLRAAISYLQYVRTVVRRDLQVFSCFTSALLGILINIFKHKAKVHRTPTGLIRVSLLGVRFFFAGLDHSRRDLEIAAECGARFVLMSYYHIRDRKAWKEHCQRLGIRVLLDSGAFTQWRAVQFGKPVDPITVESYADFIEQHRDVLFSWFNLDVIGDPVSSLANAEYLHSRGLASIEVWHAGSDIDELDRMVRDDQAMIALGGSVGLSEARREEILREVFSRFPEQNFHGLGISSKLMNMFSFFSCDSTAPLIGRRYRKIIDGQGQRKAPTEWTWKQCLEYNYRYFAGLERGLLNV